MSIEHFESVTTKAGDEGKTSLGNGERRYKSETIFELLGNLDELSSNLGLLKLQFVGKNLEQDIPTQIKEIQATLLSIGALVANPGVSNDDQVIVHRNEGVKLALSNLENWEQSLLEGFNFEGFILAGSALIPAWFDLSRTVCRRVERSLVRYVHESYTEQLRPSLAFINRLSDYLWVGGRYWARYEGITEI